MNLLSFRKDEVAVALRKLRGKDLNILYPSQNFTSFIRSKIIERAVHLANIGWEVNIDNILVGKAKMVTSWDI